MSLSTDGQWSLIGLLLIAAGTLVFEPQVTLAQEQMPAKFTASTAKPAEDGRKVKTKVAPVYPPLAKTMHVSGTVRVMVVITPAGAVKSVKALGGHPLLLESVMDAVKRWKYEAGPQETTTVVEFKFFDESS